MQNARLLKRCARAMSDGELGAEALGLLRHWNQDVERRSAALAVQFLSARLSDWEGMIAEHPANNHGWYDFIADEISIDEMAVFLLENRNYPVFLRLLEAIRAVQICDDARLAVSENIADEQQTEPTRCQGLR